MMNRKLNIAVYFLFFIPVFHINAQENILSYEHSVKYASYLFYNKLYDLAITEYERILFLEPSDTLAKLRLIQSYRLTNDLNSAKIKLNKFFPCCTDCCNKAFAIEKLKIMFAEQHYDDCLQFLSESKMLDSTTVTEFKTAILLKQFKWKEANKLAESFLLKNKPTLLITDLRDISLKGQTIRYRNPLLAASFSGIVPGSGKYYTGQWEDGLYSFLAISAFSYLTYRSLKKNGQSPYGFIFGSVAFSFYIANIYGSYKSAIRYNHNQNRKVVKSIEQWMVD